MLISALLCNGQKISRSFNKTTHIQKIMQKASLFLNMTGYKNNDAKQSSGSKKHVRKYV